MAASNEKSAGIFAERQTKGTASAVPFAHRVNLSRQARDEIDQTPR
jgi:hypothetical protein